MAALLRRGTRDTADASRGMLLFALGGQLLWRFMIAEQHQRRGIGRRAMQQVLEHWREIGATTARTSVVPSNTAATRLYESLGFRLTGEEDHGERVMSLDM